MTDCLSTACLSWRTLTIVTLLAIQTAAVHAREMSISHTADALANTSGGLEEGHTVLHNTDLVFYVGDEALPGAERLRLHVIWNDDKTFSGRYTGDAQTVANIDGGRGLRLFEAWYEHALSPGLSLRVGLYDLNSEFDALDSASLFLNGSHGMGAEFGQTGRNGPATFPVTAAGARLHWQSNANTIVRYAIVDGVPGKPDDPSSTRIEFGDDDGVLHALEVNRELAGGSRLGVGGFVYSARFDRLESGPPPAGVNRDNGNGGVYGFIDTPLAAPWLETGTLDAWLRIGVANGEFNLFDRYAGFGAVWTGPIASRPDDQLGFAVGSARTGDEARRSGGSTAHETTLELTYSLPVTDWLRLQPDIQYIRHPGADPALGSALVVGIRFQAERRLYP